MPEITFVHVTDNPNIKLKKYRQYSKLFNKVTQACLWPAYKTQDLTEEDKDWVTKAMAASELPERKRKADEISCALRDYYWMEPRNPNYASYSWTACIHNYCLTHYSDKAATGCYLKKVKGSPKCKEHWFKCTKD
jgi:hypothetical protein